MVRFLTVAGYVSMSASVLCAIPFFFAASWYWDQHAKLDFLFLPGLLYGLFSFAMLAMTSAGGLLGVIALVQLFRADRADRWTLLRSVGAFALPGLVTIGALAATSRMRRAVFEALAERAQPLIEAIEQHRLDHGRPPPSLGALVPGYLPAVPKTGHARYPDFEYERFGPGYSHAPPAEGVTWELRVPCSLGFGNWDVFFYWPTEDYPLHTGTNSIETIGRWAYLHE